MVRRPPGFLGALAILIGLGAVGLSQVRMQQVVDQQQEIIDRQDRDAELDEARRCVAAWEGREDSRNMSEKTYRRNAETLVALSTSASPDRIAAYEQQVERDVAEIRAELPNPDCDLRLARERIK